MPSRIVVIVNASAGAGPTAEAIAALAAQLRSAGLDAVVNSARNPGELVAVAERAVGDAPQCVVAGGGDGTVNIVASKLIGTGIALGVLPLGTLNHFARDLHIPSDIAAAAGNIAAGNVATVDVGEVNGRFFLNNSSIGLYPEIVRDRQFQQRHLGTGKWFAFTRATLAAMRRYHTLDVRLTANGEDHQRRTAFVMIGNNEYRVDGLNVGERSRLDAGTLSLYCTRHTGRLGLLRLAALALLGTLRQAREFEALTAREILVDTRRGRLHVAMDGEVSVMDTPLRYRVHPGALRVIVPARKPDSGA